LLVLCLPIIQASSAQAVFPSRNGRIVFSTNNQESGSQIFTVRVDGTGEVQLTNVPPENNAVDPNFSPDGRRIAFWSDVSGNPEIWVMKADGSHQTQLTDNRKHQNFTPNWSADGSRIVFARCTFPFGLQECHIAVMNADGTGITNLTKGHWGDYMPEYSPDGTQILFDSNRGGYDSAIWVMKADGSGLKRLTAPELEGFWADWSPDGSHIVFANLCCAPGSNVWVMAADGSDPHALTDMPERHNAFFPEYSPNGKRISFISDLAYSDGCCLDLYVMNVDGSSAHVIVNDQPALLAQDWGAATG